jgi:hypothetical protein
LGGSVTGFVAGDGVKSSAAAEAAKIKGLDKVVAVDNAAYERVREPILHIRPKVRIHIANWIYYHRAYPKTTLRYSWTTSKAADIHM